MNDYIKEIQEIKQKVGQDAERIITEGLGLQKKGTSNYRCPNTIAHKHQDKNPSMSWHREPMHFKCFGCDMLIDIYSYYKDHCNHTHRDIVESILGEVKYEHNVSNRVDKFRTNCKDVKPITQQCLDYILTRGINKETVQKYDIKSYKDDIAFPYYKYSNIVAYKTRDLKKDKRVAGITAGKPYLFGFQMLDDDFSELIITEGEFDCMVVNQCGYENVVSVGCGANSVSTLFEQAKEFLNKYDNLIILSDNDEAGSNMDQKFVDEFGLKARLVDKNLYKLKDINAEYYKNGKEAIDKLIESARLKVEGRRDLDMNPYRGLNARTGAYIPTGIDGIDNYINDLAPGCVTVIVGRTNAGKTTFTKQIITNAINKGNKVFCVSGEGDQEMFINEIYKNVIGNDNRYFDNVKHHKRWHKEPKKEVLKALQLWHKKKLVLFSKGESKLKTMDQLFSILANEIKIKKHNLVVIDNLMSLLTISKDTTKNDAQGEFVQQCCDIAKVYNIHIIVVVHPKKDDQKGKELNIENISGSMDIGNKADNIFGLYRNADGEELGGKIKVLKNRYYSELPEVTTSFDEDTGLLNEVIEGEENGKYTRKVKKYNFGKWKKYLENREIEGEQEAIVDCPF